MDKTKEKGGSLTSRTHCAGSALARLGHLSVPAWKPTPLPPMAVLTGTESLLQAHRHVTSSRKPFLTPDRVRFPTHNLG